MILNCANSKFLSKSCLKYLLQLFGLHVKPYSSFFSGPLWPHSHPTLTPKSFCTSSADLYLLWIENARSGNLKIRCNKIVQIETRRLRDRATSGPRTVDRSIRVDPGPSTDTPLRLAVTRAEIVGPRLLAIALGLATASKLRQ